MQIQHTLNKYLALKPIWSKRLSMGLEYDISSTHGALIGLFI